MQNPRFDSFYKQFISPLTRFVFKKIGSNPEMADEVVSATMVAAWRGLTTFKHKSSYFTWLCRIALNKIADYYRDQINDRSHIVVPALRAMSLIEAKDIKPEERLVLNELRKSVNDCLDLLTPEKRKLLQFRYWQDLSYKQIAKIMGTTERAIEGKLYRAKNEFAKVWTLQSR